MRRGVIRRTERVKSWRRKAGREEEYCRRKDRRRKRRERAGTGGIKVQKVRSGEGEEGGEGWSETFLEKF